ncbi:MAG: FtsQ-type POTRA domain-containing protein [Clostridia bacterium]|nr:FtsQ-type POTRA domain-containing protein [Clostridia bacterium]
MDGNGNGLNEIQSERESKQTRRVAFYVVIIIALAVTVALSLFGFFFRVGTVSSEGTEIYSEKEIIENSGIKNGESVFFISEKKVGERLKKQFPYLESVELDIDLPSSVKIIATERKATAYLKLKGDYYLLSDDLYVLERTGYEKITPGMIEISTLITSLKSVIVGEQLEFFYKKTTDNLVELIEVLEENGIIDKVSLIKANDRFNISMRYDNRFNVFVGSVASIEIKIPFLKEILKKLSAEPDVKGTIDISSEKKATFSKDR